MKEIDRLRREIDGIDREILRLLERRISIAEKIGRIKREYGLPIEDREREAEILDRAGKFRKVFEAILETSKQVQRDRPDMEWIWGAIGIIGYGKMGKLFADIFRDITEVYVYDIDTNKYDRSEGVIACRNMEEVVLNSRYIMVSVDLGRIPDVLKHLRDLIIDKRYLDKHIFDIGTFKKDTVAILKSFPDWVKVCSIHPLFGPGIDTHIGETIVIIPIEDRWDDAEEIASLFRYLGFRIVYSDMEEHDVAMAYLIALPYVLGYSYGDLIESKSIDIDKFPTKSGRYLLNYYWNVVLKDGMQFLEEITKNNYTKDSIKEIIGIVGRFLDIAKT